MKFLTLEIENFLSISEAKIGLDGQGLVGVQTFKVVVARDDLDVDLQRLTDPLEGLEGGVQHRRGDVAAHMKQVTCNAQRGPAGCLQRLRGSNELVEDRLQPGVHAIRVDLRELRPVVAVQIAH
jgi:hypothetical protein